MIYTPAFDTFNTIYRMLHILSHFDTEKYVEVERMRIFDYYLLFPHRAHKIRLKPGEGEFRVHLKRFVSSKVNPYHTITNDRRLFERLRPYQMIALSHIASYGLISPEHILNQQVKVTDPDKLRDVISRLEKMEGIEGNVLSWLCLCFRTTPINGVFGLKYRTNLLESKYDGC